jgi:hypothetical protein
MILRGLTYVVAASSALLFLSEGDRAAVLQALRRLRRTA